MRQSYPFCEAQCHTSATATGRIVLVDDEPELLELLAEMLRRAGYEISAHTDPASVRLFVAEHPNWADIILSDLYMPQEDGLSLLQDLLAANESVVGMVLTGYATMQSAVQAMRTGVFDFITKPIDSTALAVAVKRGMDHRKLLLENENYQRHMETLVQERSMALRDAFDQLERSYEFTLESLVSMLEAREKATGDHSKRVTAISVILAQALGVSGEELEVVRRGAFLHDIGKVAIPDAILQKPGKLDPDEWQTMKTHVDIGYSILRNHPDIQAVAELVYSHHERFDGSGYPRGLKGEQICLGARIFAVADSYDAIRSSRPYSPACSSDQTVREITRCRCTQFDPVVVDLLPSCHAEIERLWTTQSDTPDSVTLFTGKKRP